jgi:hypothetical protein
MELAEAESNFGNRGTHRPAGATGTTVVQLSFTKPRLLNAGQIPGTSDNGGAA